MSYYEPRAHHVPLTRMRNREKKDDGKCKRCYHTRKPDPNGDIHAYLCNDCQFDQNMIIWLNGGHLVSMEEEGLDNSDSVMYDIWYYRKYFLNK